VNAGPVTCSLTSMVAKAAAGWAEQGVDPAAFTMNEFFVPNTAGCPWGGVANLGCNDDGDEDTNTPCLAAVAYSSDRIRMHEFGHNLGFAHAWYNGNEYGDWTCTMGSGSSFAAASRFVRGWFPEHSRAEINQIPGTYTLSGLTKNPHEAQDGDRHTLQSDNLLVSYDDRVGAGQLSVHKQYGLYHVTIMQDVISTVGTTLFVEGLAITLTELRSDIKKAKLIVEHAPSPPPSAPAVPMEVVWRCYYDYWVGGGVGTLDYGQEGFLQNCVDDPECVAVSGHSSERYQAYKIVDPAPNAGSNHMTREECNAQATTKWSYWVYEEVPIKATG